MRRFHYEMKMVGHEDEGDQTNSVGLNRTGKEFQKFRSIELGQEDLLSSVAPAGHVVAGVFILDA
jgi:hypothetical protein